MEKWEAAKRAKTNPFNDSCTKSFFTYTITVLDSVEWIVKIYLKSNEERQSSPFEGKEKGLILSLTYIIFYIITPESQEGSLQQSN